MFKIKKFSTLIYYLFDCSFWTSVICLETNKTIVNLSLTLFLLRQQQLDLCFTFTECIVTRSKLFMLLNTFTSKQNIIRKLSLSEVNFLQT